MKQVAFIGDPHGNLAGYTAVTEVLNALGVKERHITGDLSGKLSPDAGEYASAVTRDQASFTRGARDAAAQRNSSLRNCLKAGTRSKKQLAHMTNPRAAMLEAAKRHNQNTYGKFRDIDPTAKTNAGNHDDGAVLEEIHKDNYLQTGRSTSNGIKYVTLNGGGAGPDKEMGGVENPDSRADFPGKDEWRSREGKEILLQPGEDNQIDVLETHCGLPKPGRHNDANSSQNLDTLIERERMGLPKVGLLVEGHHHTSRVHFGWDTYTQETTGTQLEQLTLSPGVLAYNTVDPNQTSSHGSFAVTKFNDKNQGVQVDEYHVVNALEGIQKVIHHGTHYADHENKKVTFKGVNKTIYSEAIKNDFKPSKELDKNYDLQAKGLNLNYAGEGEKDWDPFKLDLRIKANLSISGLYVEQAQTEVKHAFDVVGNEWKRTSAKEFDADSQLEQQMKVAKILAGKAAKKFGVNLDQIDTDDIGYFEDRLVEAAFGIQFDDIQKATDVKTKKFADIGDKWGHGILEQIEKSLRGKYEQHIIAPITKKQWASVVDNVYMPQSVERKRELTTQEAIGVFVKGLNAGYIDEATALGTGLYKKKEDLKANKYDDEAINEAFGIKAVKEKSHSLERTLLEGEDPAQLQEALNNGVPVYTNSDGDYIPTAEGPKYLTDEQKSSLEYETKNIKNMLDNNEAKLVADGNNYMANIEGRNILLDMEKEGIDPSDYQKMPLWEAQRSQQIANMQAQQQEQQQNQAMRNVLQNAQRQQQEQPQQEQIRPNVVNQPAANNDNGYQNLGQQPQEQATPGLVNQPAANDDRYQRAA